MKPVIPYIHKYSIINPWVVGVFDGFIRKQIWLNLWAAGAVTDHK